MSRMNENAEQENPGPLAGKKIVVTRSVRQAPNLSLGLEALGATVHEFPTIDIKLLAAEVPPTLKNIDWIIFTSANAVRGLHSSARAQNLYLRFPKVKICCVGPATEQIAKKAALNVDLLPDVFTAGDIFVALQKTEGDLRGKRILLPRGNIPNPTLRDQLLAAGAQVETIIVYETECPPRNEETVKELMDLAPDMITFTSGSTAKNFVALMGKDNVAALASKAAFASIGPETTKAAVAKGMEVYVEPDQHDIPGLIEAIQKYYS
jgi:uroporphyrinogen-III synthase